MKGRAFLAFLAMLLMMAAAFGIGAYRAYFDEKLQVELAMSSLTDVLNSRVEMAYNLLTVAGRHLNEGEPLLGAVRGHLDVLEGSGGLRAKATANEQLTRDSKALLKLLEESPSVQADERDLRYVTGLLPRGFEQSAQWADAGAYNEAARAYNERLTRSASGLAARLLGIEEAEYFTARPEGT